jgi:hypothetical protein
MCKHLKTDAWKFRLNLAETKALNTQPVMAAAADSDYHQNWNTIKRTIHIFGMM